MAEAPTRPDSNKPGYPKATERDEAKALLRRLADVNGLPVGVMQDAAELLTKMVNKIEDAAKEIRALPLPDASARAEVKAVARLNAADASHARLVAALREWAAEHMDQWEKLKVSTPHGSIFVTISMQSDYPDSFDDAADLTDIPAIAIAGL